VDSIHVDLEFSAFYPYQERNRIVMDLSQK